MAIQFSSYYRFPASGATDIAVPICYPGGQWVPLRINVHFVNITGSGTDTADATLDLRTDLSNKGTTYNARIVQAVTCGIASDLLIRWSDDEHAAWIMQPNEALVLNWVNPRASQISWGMVATLGIV